MSTIYKRERSPFWQARIVVGGRPERISLKERDERKAQKAADAEERRRNADFEAAQGLKLVEAAALFFGSSKLRASTILAYKSSLANVLGVLGDFPLKSLTHDRLDHYVRVRLKGGVTVAIRRDLAFLSSLMAKSRRFEGGPITNPVRDYGKEHIPAGETRGLWLQPEQLRTLLEGCTQQYQRVFIVLAVLTGMRSQELLQLRWEEVDWEKRQIVLGNLNVLRTKNGQSRIIPLTDQAFNTLSDTLCNRIGKWVFQNPATDEPYTTLKTFWNRLTKQAGFPGLRIHDLRHTFASWGKQDGLDDLVLMNIMGHKTRSMVGRYAHLSPVGLDNGLRRLNEGTHATHFLTHNPKISGK